MECNIEKNKSNCTCTYEPCSRKGKCCECIAYHWNLGELPGCLFPPEVERTYDRSIEKFIETYKKNQDIIYHEEENRRQNISYPVTWLPSLPVIRYKRQYKTVGQASRLSIIIKQRGVQKYVPTYQKPRTEN